MSKLSWLGLSEPFSSLSHLILAVFFLVAGILTIIRARGNSARVCSLVVYNLGLVFLFSMSGVYHLLPRGTTANYVLKILDHAGIFVMIAGTFTPLHVILLRGVARWLPLLIIWSLAIVGLTMTAIFFEEMPEWLLLSFFIAMGWMSLISLFRIMKVDPTTAKLIVLGGVLYTIGAIFDFTRWPVLIPQIWESHEMFHIFVAAGALVHWRAIFRISNKPMSHKLVVHIKEMPEQLIAYPTSERILFQAKALEELKQQVQEWVSAAFHPQHRPVQIRFRYFKEEYYSIEINSSQNKENNP